MRGQRVRYSTGHGKHNKQAQHAPPYIFERSKNVRRQEAWFSGHSVSASVKGKEEIPSVVYQAGKARIDYRGGIRLLDDRRAVKLCNQR